MPGEPETGLSSSFNKLGEEETPALDTYREFLHTVSHVCAFDAASVAALLNVNVRKLLVIDELVKTAHSMDRTIQFNFPHCHMRLTSFDEISRWLGAYNAQQLQYERRQ